MNTVIYILLGAGLVFFGGTTLAAFCWAAGSGQLRNLGEGSKVIFDDGEPVGEATDVFADVPGRLPPRGAAAGGGKL